MAKKSFGKVKVKRIKPELSDIPKDCGYMKQFEHNIDMNSNGIMGDCIEWCQINCTGKWGWWFEPAGEIVNPQNHWEDQNSFMSFEKKIDATRFWLAIGVNNMGDKSR
tara:strand:+ start:952 stop:1275 length:324 start_codon:yes stop_codon:yes gene_type:complete